MLSTWALAGGEGERVRSCDSVPLGISTSRGETGTQQTVEETKIHNMQKGKGNVWMEDMQAQT